LGRRFQATASDLMRGQWCAACGQAMGLANAAVCMRPTANTRANARDPTSHKYYHQKTATKLRCRLPAVVQLLRGLAAVHHDVDDRVDVQVARVGGGSVWLAWQQLVAARGGGGGRWTLKSSGCLRGYTHTSGAAEAEDGT
jgi:hypothetical protein